MTDLLLVSMQNVSQFNVIDLTRGTLFFTAVLTSEKAKQESGKSTQGKEVIDRIPYGKKFSPNANYKDCKSFN